MEENLYIYNSIKKVPEEAKKQITGGRLKGMTDIKPMWRIEKLTSIFGSCGLGWYTETKKKEIIDGANGEKIAVVDIELFVNYKKPYALDTDLWSKGIEGSGGSSFIANEKSGLYTSDECFKMAYTDALSVACKSLGMGADVYWGDSKYDTSEKITTKEEAEKYVITFGKKHKNETLKEIYETDPSYIDWLLDNEKTDDVIKQAINLMLSNTNSSKELSPSDFENSKMIDELQTQLIELYVHENLTTLEGVLTQFKVDSLDKLKFEEAEQVIKVLQKRKEKIGKEKKEVF